MAVTISTTSAPQSASAAAQRRRWPRWLCVAGWGLLLVVLAEPARIL